eukprot:GHVU01184213.1.p3 GENE.GHVU01184213.1~~GHVU01184213.1.p3  ORF type:complete len:105 (-),score=6.97 GHVU01184213.1:542-856(-)
MTAQMDTLRKITLARWVSLHELKNLLSSLSKYVKQTTAAITQPHMAKVNPMYPSTTLAGPGTQSPWSDLVVGWSHVVVREAPRKTSHANILLQRLLKTPIVKPA